MSPRSILYFVGVALLASIPIARGDGAKTPPLLGIRGKIGEAVSEAIERSSHVEVGWLHVVAASEAEAETLKGPDRIVGYPAAGPLKTISKAQATNLASIILRDESYASGSRGRCANNRFLGIRFVDADADFEFAIGLPCYQAVWAHRRNGAIERSGESFSKKATERIEAILRSELQRAPR